MSTYKHHIAILGAGTIGLSMTALHLRRPDTRVTLYDPRPDTESQLRATLPSFLDTTASSKEAQDKLIDTLLATNRLALASSIGQAVSTVTIIQEQTPERADGKQALWKQVAQAVGGPHVHLWSSSSGIPASVQVEGCPAWLKETLLVAHPFNPPHVMPLVEIVPGPETAPERAEFARGYFGGIPGPGRLASDQTSSSLRESAVQHYRPVALRKEIPGFVGNRLAFALLKEACYLVGEGVVSAAELDEIVMASLGPRWAGSGVFESYHAGGGEGGIGAFLQKLAPTLKDVWGQLGEVEIRTEGKREGMGGEDDGRERWKEVVVRQTEEAYGTSTSAETRAKKEVMLRGVVEMQKQQVSTTTLD